MVEQELLFEAIEQLPSTKRVVGDAFEAHAEFDAILRELADISANNDEWIYRVLELKQMIQDHILMEEERIFPAARAELGEMRAEQLGRQIDERERTDQGHT